MADLLKQIEDLEEERDTHLTFATRATRGIEAILRPISEAMGCHTTGTSYSGRDRFQHEEGIVQVEWSAGDWSNEVDIPIEVLNAHDAIEAAKAYRQKVKDAEEASAVEAKRQQLAQLKAELGES